MLSSTTKLLSAEVPGRRTKIPAQHKADGRKPPCHQTICCMTPTVDIYKTQYKKNQVTTIDLINNLKEVTDNLQLNDRAIKTLSKIKITSSKEDLYPDFLKGFSREEIIFKPRQQLIELYNYSGFDPSVMTIIGIYIEDKTKKWADHLMPIGYFEYQVHLDGEYINDHFEITESKKTDFHDKSKA